jgi:hypothetical protein
MPRTAAEPGSIRKPERGTIRSFTPMKLPAVAFPETPSTV